MPLWMQPHSVIIYDENLEYTVVEGGELSEEEISESEDIALVGLEDHSEEMIARPNTKVEYDLHGFIQNVYYLVPGTMDEYHLSSPTQSRARTGILKQGDTVTYGRYRNNDVGDLPKAILDVWSDSSINPIQELTTYGTIDNVYSGSIAFAAIAYN